MKIPSVLDLSKRLTLRLFSSGVLSVLAGVSLFVTGHPFRRATDCRTAIESALRKLGRDHCPLVLVGYSMGGALSIAVGAGAPVDGLILMAPSWRPEFPLMTLMGFALRPSLPQALRPLRRANFSDIRLRPFLAGFFPNVDLEDPAVQEELRQLALPISLFGTLRQVSRQGFQRASEIHVPTLVPQGRRDETVRRENTLKILGRLPASARYVELDGGHKLVDADQPTWPKLSSRTWITC